MSASDRTPVILSAARTPIGRFLGGLAPLTAPQLGAVAIRAAVDRARREVAALIGSRANEIVFLSGGTEANNLAIRGLCEATEAHGKHVITSRIEHSSVRGICEALETRGWEVTWLPVYNDGIVRPEDVRAALRPDTVLVTVARRLGEARVPVVHPQPGGRRRVRSSRYRRVARFRQVGDRPDRSSGWHRVLLRTLLELRPGH